ncbi:MAG: LicD family protein [Erysipelotrichaceae bacterium]|nr:LicD family protein [Clostridia bacterium]MBQ6217752.1 LicD family protein [Erysipelotrichaceae bacterium]
MKKKTDDTLKLKELWNEQLQILDRIDELCGKENIHYSLYAGSLLGAVRHHGFIPWDDDLDVCMSRADYERFIKVWDNEEHPGYIMQNKDNTPSFTQSFSKIRKDHTTFIQFEWEKNRYHTGIFVDIFPIDRIPEGFFMQKRFLWDCMRYQLYTREFVPPKASVITKLVSKLFLKLTGTEYRKEFRKHFEEKLNEYDKHSNWNTSAIESMQSVRQKLPVNLLDGFIRLEFEGKQYECFEKWHEYLTDKYGDYMKLPPENERTWNHHPLILDFEHNYEELTDER